MGFVDLLLLPVIGILGICASGFVLPDSVGTLDCLRRSRLPGMPTIDDHLT